VGICWILNLRGLKSIPTLELLGCLCLSFHGDVTCAV
jgi:hypothetical protein